VKQLRHPDDWKNKDHEDPKYEKAGEKVGGTDYSFQMDLSFNF